ncbi:MAG: YbaK/EbsC family protein [Balneolaceae bacterium]|nr:YbaK/EbsC family protein [Balneolaceae bacterium]
MPLERLTKYLDNHDKKYVVIKHSKAYTAQEIAASAHIPGREMAKTVMLNIDGDLEMLVLPSTHEVDIEQVKKAIDAGEVKLASEDEFEQLFPDCDLGAMPPFGNLYDIETLVAESLLEDEEIAFNAGTHRELIRLSLEDYRELVDPKIIRASVRRHA